MRKYTEQILRDAVKTSLSYSDVCRTIGMNRATGSSYELVKNRINEYNIDISHFLGKAAYAGKRNPNYNNRKKVCEILTDGYQYRVSHIRLETALKEIGVECKCSVCSLNNWLGKPITLDVDHIDGDWSNCKEENLRFLCTNCHRQTDTFARKNRK